MDTSEFLYLIRPTRPEMLTGVMTEAEETAIAAHFAYLKGLADNGIVRLAGRTQETGERAFGIIVFTATSQAAARKLVDEDPAVIGQVMTAELFPFRVAVESWLQGVTP